MNYSQYTNLPYNYNIQNPYVQYQPLYRIYPVSNTESVDETMLLEEDRQINDQGRRPFVIDIEEAAERNRAFRRAIWTGNYLQVTIMSIGVGDDVGLEVHPDVDQFLRIEEGEGIVQMGDRRNQLNYVRRVSENSAIFVPAGKWHNLTNTGDEPLKLYSIYAPPEHPFGTVHRTKADAIAAEESTYQINPSFYRKISDEWHEH